MKKYLLFLLTLSSILSCSKNDFNGELSPEDAPEIIPSSRVVSKSQAGAFCQKAINAIDNYSGFDVVNRPKRELASVIPVCNEKNSPLMYVANFKNQSGFMLISADKESDTFILAYGERGELIPDKMDKNGPFYTMIEEQKDSIDAKLSQGIHLENNNYQMWEALCDDSGYSIDLELVNSSYEDDPEILTKSRHKDSYGKMTVPVSYIISSFTWGQGRGYNEDAPNPGVDYAGCPAVAAGLICLYHSYPPIYDYENMPCEVTVHTSNAVSKMLRNIGNRMPGYEWSSSGSGATGMAILAGLKRLGFKNAKLEDYSFELAYNDIYNRRPIILGGESKQGGKHVWVADGYMEQSWKVTQSFVGIKIKSWYEYQDNFFMNWGWDGKNNAWVDQDSWPSYGTDRKMWYNIFPVETN